MPITKPRLNLFGPRTDKPRALPRRGDAILDHIEGLMKEANEYRSGCHGGMSLEAEWELGGHMALGNHHVEARFHQTDGQTQGYRIWHAMDDEAGGSRKAVLNRTGNAIFANVADQFQRAPVIRLEAMQAGRDDVWIMSRAGGQVLYDVMIAPLEQIDGEEQADLEAAGDDLDAGMMVLVEAEQARQQHNERFPVMLRREQLVGRQDGHGPTETLDETEAAYVKQLIAAGYLKRNDLIAINDDARADLAQKAWDHLWDLADGDTRMLLNEYKSACFGQQPIMLQWSTERPKPHQFWLRNISLRNIWLDAAESESIDDAQYVIVDCLEPAEEVRRRYPGNDDAITDAAHQGVTGGQSMRLRHSSAWRNTDYQRPMVLVRTAWLRGQEVPKDEREAVEDGDVTREAVLDETGAPLTDPETGRRMWRYIAPDGRETDPVRKVGGRSAPGMAPWPKGPGIRQIVYLPANQTKLEDVRCPFADIPIAWNLNLPRPSGLYGQGEALRLKDVQQEINHRLSLIREHGRSELYPQVYMPQSVYERLGANNFNLHSEPGAIIPLDDESWAFVMQNGGFNAMGQQINALHPSHVEFLKMMLEEHDNLSGNVGIRQGRAPFSGASGEIVKELGAQAAGVLSIRTRFTETAIRKLALLGLDAAVKWLPESEWVKLADHLELPAIQMLVEQMHWSEMNITVEVASGRGANQRVDDERAIGLYDRKLLDRRTTMERLRVGDVDEINRRLLEDQGMPQTPAAAGAAQMPDRATPSVSRAPEALARAGV